MEDGEEINVVFTDVAEAQAAAAESAFGLRSVAADGPAVHAETLEGVKLTAVVTGAGFEVPACMLVSAFSKTKLTQVRTIDPPETPLDIQAYETLTALLMSVSPEFKRLFHDELFRKLSAHAADAQQQ